MGPDGEAAPASTSVRAGFGSRSGPPSVRGPSDSGGRGRDLSRNWRPASLHHCLPRPRRDAQCGIVSHRRPASSAGFTCQGGRTSAGQGEEDGSQNLSRSRVQTEVALLPHLRFTRDKRGYENTYVVHAVRRRGKARQRILYWFRTPPNIRVGRAALDEEAIRAIEECNPDVEFDWTKILEARPAPAAAELPERERRRRPREGQTEGPARSPEAPAHRVEPSRPDSSIDADAIEASAPPPEVTEPAGVQIEPMPVLETASDFVDVPEFEPPALVPVTVYHGGVDVLIAEGADTPRLSAVEARLGSEQLGRVRARHAEILTRIKERLGGDPVRLEEMRRAADALNPDGWVTDAEIATGLQHFDAQLGEIRRALGIKRRRRSRRGGRRRRPQGATPGPNAISDEPASSAVHTRPTDGAEELDDDATEAESDGEDPSD